MPSALFSFKQADHPILGGFSPPRKVQTPPEVVDEARQRHYQDQPFSTAALMGGAAGLAAPTALGLLLDHKAVLRNPMPYLHAGAVMSPLGAVTGVGAEAAGRLLTRGLGPGFDRRRWHRDQDPHRWNSALRTAPLVAALLAGRALPSLLQRMPELQGKQASAGWSEWLKNKTQNALDPVKRYISNLPGLYGYHKGHVENAIKYLPKAYDMGIKDIPAQPQAAAQPGTNEWRRELFRRGLGVHNAGPNDAFKVSPDGTLQAADRFFKNDEMDPGQAWQLLGSDAASELEGKEHSAYDRAARSGKPNANKSVVSAPTDSSVFSNYTMKYKGNGIFNVSDKWDVGLNPGEENKLDGKGVVGLARKTLDKMMTPAVFNQDFQQRRDGSVVRINQTPVPSHPSVPAVKGSSALRDHKTRLRDAEAQVAVPTQGQIEGGGNLGSWKIASHLMDDFQKGAHGQVMLHDIDRSCTHHNVVSRVSQGGIASVQAHDIWMAKHAAARLAPLAPLMGAYSLKSCAGVETQTRLFLPQLLQERNIQIEKKTLGSTPVSCVVQQGKKGSSQSAAVFGSPFSLLLQPAGTAEMHVSPFVHLKLAQRLGFATFAAGDAASFQRFSHPAFSSNTSAVEPDRVFGVGDQITQGFGGAKYAGRGVTSFWGVLDEMNTSFPFERLNGIENPVAVAARHELPFSFFKASSQSESLKRFTRAGSAHKPDGNPSKAQINAGNYKMQHLQIHGLEITLETASGQERKGVAADGKPWSVTLTDPYGYIKNTDSAEPGDQMDVFIGPDPSSEAVYVVDQNKPGTTRFDEHKVVLGCTTMAEAKALYLRNYSKGWTGFRDITPMTMPQFKSWLKKGDVTRPLAGQQFADFHKQANAWRAISLALLKAQRKGGLRPGTSPIIGKDVAALAAAAMGAGWFAGDAYFKRKAQALTEENEALSSERDALTAEQSAEYERLKPRAGKAWQAYFESKHPVGPDGQYLTPLTPQEVEDKSRIHALLGTQPEKPVTPTSQSTSHPAVTDYAPSLRDAGFGAGGAALGYGLGSLMLPENDEEDAPALQRYAPHIGAALGAGGGMLLSRYLQGSTKQAFDWNALAQSIKEQAPRLHVPEATVGALAGGAAGALYHGASSLWEDPRHHARQSLLRRALIGAGIGGVGANLVGDRARRYISNMPNPATYDINSKLQEMGAAGWKGFMTGAIKDKPIPLTAENSHITPMRMIRRETLRRGFGVHTDDPISDYLKVIGKSRNGADILNLSDRFFDKNQQIRPEFRDVWQQLAPRDFNSIMSAPSGKFVHANGPFLGNFSARNFGDTAQFLDRWDFDLHPDERSDMKSNLMDWWRGAAKPQPFQNMGLQFNLGKQRADATKSMLARHAVDQTVAKNMPYFFQSFRIPTPEEGQAYDAWDSPELPYRIPLFNDK